MSSQMLLMTLFIVKHLIFDFLLQTPFQYLNKGKYGHPGGLLHTGLAVAGSFLALFIFNLWQQEVSSGTLGTSLGKQSPWDLYVINFPWAFFSVVLSAEALIHYHMDWLKVQICRKMHWTAANSNWYFHLLGFDQTVHYLTYVGMITWIFMK